MPRRPRPATRPPPANASAKTKAIAKPELAATKAVHKSKQVSKHTESSSSSAEEQEEQEADSSHTSGSEDSDGTSAHEYDEEAELDVDAPRVAQWQEDEDVVSDDEDQESTDDEKNAGPSQLKSLQRDLSSLPLGALRKAQHALTHAKATSESASDDSDDSQSDDDSPEQVLSAKGKEKEKVEWSIKRRTDIAKRSSKHAPIEITSKRPVTRNRTVVEVKSIQSRDPRFLSLAGEFSSEKFQKRYSFLTDSHKGELKTLRDNLKRARKMLASSPRELQAERAYEVERLEMAVKRAESTVNTDRRNQIDQAALSQVAKEEKTKRKDGKGGWWLKDSDKKEILVRARYDALAAAGGQRAVKKAIEKKQKKIGQKEKKSRPFSEKRPHDGGADEGWAGKRRRV